MVPIVEDIGAGAELLAEAGEVVFAEHLQAGQSLVGGELLLQVRVADPQQCLAVLGAILERHLQRLRERQGKRSSGRVVNQLELGATLLRVRHAQQPQQPVPEPLELVLCLVDAHALPRRA